MFAFIVLDLDAGSSTDFEIISLGLKRVWNRNRFDILSLKF
jgi:hypothetical protein